MFVLLTEIESLNLLFHFSDDERSEFFNARISKKKSIEISDSEWNKILLRKEEYDNFNFKISETARLNNLGIELEKKGEIDTAISVYEENIVLGHTATHSFDRLMILYHKQKDYKSEKKVISKALDIFQKENERRKINAITQRPHLKKEIEVAFLSNEKCFDEAGFCIYNPYSLNKWNNRLIKLTQKI